MQSYYIQQFQVYIKMIRGSQQSNQSRIKQQKITYKQAQKNRQMNCSNNFLAGQMKNFEQKIKSIFNKPNDQIRSSHSQVRKRSEEQEAKHFQEIQNYTERSEVTNQSTFQQNYAQNSDKKFTCGNNISQMIKNNSELFSMATKLKQPQRLNISDLETSLKKQNLINAQNKQYRQPLQNSPKKIKTVKQFDQKSSLKSSRIVTKLNQMEQFYTDKIRKLTIQNSYLLSQQANLQSQNKSLIQSVSIFKQIAQRKKSDMDAQMDQKLNQIKQVLMQRFSLEARQSYKAYIDQVKKINQNLIEQRKKRTYYQSQCKVLASQKLNIQQMYKQLLSNHKDLMRLEINQSQSQINSQIYIQSPCDGNSQQKIQVPQNQQTNNSNTIAVPNVIYNSRKIHSNFLKEGQSREEDSLIKSQKNKSQKNYKTSIKNSKIKQVKSHKQKIRKNHAKLQMSRQELIPFLAEGIQELKEKLKLK